MGWLVNLVVSAIIVAVIFVKIFSVILDGIAGPSPHAAVAKTGVLMSVWTIFTTATGLRAATGFLRKLRHSNKKVSDRADLLLK